MNSTRSPYATLEITTSNPVPPENSNAPQVPSPVPMNLNIDPHRDTYVMKLVREALLQLLMCESLMDKFSLPACKPTVHCSSSHASIPTHFPLLNVAILSISYTQ